MLLKSFNLPENTATATFHTRLNGNILSAKTRAYICGNGYFKCGIDVVVTPENVKIDTWTVEDSMHTWNFTATVTPEGKLVKGRVNCFALGPQLMDQEYLDLFIEEMSEKKWDEIVLKPVDPVL